MWTWSHWPLGPVFPNMWCYLSTAKAKSFQSSKVSCAVLQNKERCYSLMSVTWSVTRSWRQWKALFTLQFPVHTWQQASDASSLTYIVDTTLNSLVFNVLIYYVLSNSSIFCSLTSEYKKFLVRTVQAPPTDLLPWRPAWVFSVGFGVFLQGWASSLKYLPWGWGRTSPSSAPCADSRSDRLEEYIKLRFWGWAVYCPVTAPRRHFPGWLSGPGPPLRRDPAAGHRWRSPVGPPSGSPASRGAVPGTEAPGAAGAAERGGERRWAGPPLAMQRSLAEAADVTSPPGGARPRRPLGARGRWRPRREAWRPLGARPRLRTATAPQSCRLGALRPGGVSRVSGRLCCPPAIPPFPWGNIPTGSVSEVWEGWGVPHKLPLAA